MMILIAAALVAAQPAAAPAHAQGQMPMMQMGQSGEHKAMDCCKDCCKDMAKMHEGHDAERGAQPR
ncbi:MAG: hypothetical protein ABI454_01995 [Sphingomicrobium sp.]